MPSESIGVIACDHQGCDQSLTAPTRAAAELDAVLDHGWYYSAADNVAYCAAHRDARGLDLAPVPIPGCTCGAMHRHHCGLLRPRGEPTTVPWIDGPEQGIAETVSAPLEPGGEPRAATEYRVVTDDDLEI